MSKATADFAEPRVEVEHRENGEIVLRNPTPLPAAARCVGQWLEHWAALTPERVFLAERARVTAPWRTVSYADALRAARSIAAWLLGADLGPERPAAVLSDNGIDHALFALGAMHAGIPVAALSPAYSLMSGDHAKLRSMLTLLSPGVLYAADTGRYGSALSAIANSHKAPVIASTGAADVPFSTLLGAAHTPAVERAFQAIEADTVARLLFTSGSTGAPKAVVNTHAMLCSNQEARAANWPFLNEVPPVLVDWLPWSHTFGANHNFNMVLRNGGTLYVDAGKPAPQLFATTLANLKDVRPNLCFNVPRGYDMLVAALRQDAGLRDAFFENLRLVFYAAAALPQHLWEALQGLSLAARGRAVPMLSAWGATETAPLATDCHFQAARSGNMGLPVPGVELKLVPAAGKLEVRVRGPNVTPGYWKAPQQTAKAFDEEGFYRAGDAVRFADPERPQAGLYFDGRISEDFKLSNGTWVSSGALRVAGVEALAPLAEDIVVAGHDRDQVGFLVFPAVAACRTAADLGQQAPLEAVLGSVPLRRQIAQALTRLREAFSGASGHAAVARFLTHPPDVDAGEVTDKGYINQRAVLDARNDQVTRLFDRSDPDSIWLS